MDVEIVSGHRYTDPDVLSLIRSGKTGPLDPRREVIRRARALNQRFRNLGGSESNPRERLNILASLAGVSVEGSYSTNGGGKHEALIYTTAEGTRKVFYRESSSEGRTNFSIAHEIIHTFFKSSRAGAHFRGFHTDSSREANELERLCDLGAAEIALPLEEFLQCLGDDFGLHAIPKICEQFAVSFEAAVYRLATAHPGVAMAGLLRYRLKVQEQRALAAKHEQIDLFPRRPPTKISVEPKYRRQSLYGSDMCSTLHLIPWNKSFEQGSCVYSAAESHAVESGLERLPNKSEGLGYLQAVVAPFQRLEAHKQFGDVLFFWEAVPA